HRGASRARSGRSGTTPRRDSASRARLQLQGNRRARRHRRDCREAAIEPRRGTAACLAERTRREMTTAPAELRARLAADYQPVRRLRSPWARALWILPLALVSLTAAPVVFSVRPDAPNLGWIGVWGVSIAQALIGLLVVGAALRESIPGRDWSRAAVALWIGLPIVAVVAVTLVSWETSAVTLLRGVSLLC